MKLSPQQLVELLTPSRERVYRMWTIAYTLSKEQYNGTVNECRDPLQNPISPGYLEGPAGYVFFVDELLMLRIQKSETV